MTNYLFSYDVSNNKLRTKVSKTLLQAGCIRVQKSVFFAPDFTTKELKKLRHDVNVLLKNKIETNDSLLCISINKQDFRRMIWVEGETALLQDAKKRHSRLF